MTWVSAMAPVRMRNGASGEMMDLGPEPVFMSNLKPDHPWLQQPNIKVHHDMPPPALEGAGDGDGGDGDGGDAGPPPPAPKARSRKSRK